MVSIGRRNKKLALFFQPAVNIITSLLQTLVSRFCSMYYDIFQSFALVPSLTLWYCVCRKFFDVQNKPTPTNGAYTTGKLELHVDLVNLMATPQVSYTKLPHCCSSYIAVFPA